MSGFPDFSKYAVKYDTAPREAVTEPSQALRNVGAAVALACQLQADADAGWMWIVHPTSVGGMLTAAEVYKLLGGAAALYRSTSAYRLKVQGQYRTGDSFYVRVFADGRQEARSVGDGGAWSVVYFPYDVNAVGEVSVGDGEAFGFWGDDTAKVRQFEVIAQRTLLDDANRDYWPECDAEVAPAPPVSIVNLTPHALNIQREDGSMLEVPPSGMLARCAETREPRPAIAGLPVTLAGFGAVEGLPEPRPGVVYVVSALVLAQVQDRADVFAPGPAIRDDQGRIIAARGLSCTPVYEVRS